MEPDAYTLSMLYLANSMYNPEAGVTVLYNLVISATLDHEQRVEDMIEREIQSLSVPKRTVSIIRSKKVEEKVGKPCVSCNTVV